MLKLLFPLALLVAGSLAGCQSPSSSTLKDTAATRPTTDAPAAPPAAPVATEAAARTAVARHLQTLPNAALFVPDSARVLNNNLSWQVLVPRTDWAGHLPNRARFEVDKRTGQVSSQPVK